jgi:hypothetical protein
LGERNAARDIQSMLEKYPEVAQKVSHFRFGGQGQRDALVPQDFSTLIEVIFLFPGRPVAQVRQGGGGADLRALPRR